MPLITKNKVHFVSTYFSQPSHPITINLIGVGGTGSLLLGRLTKLHLVLLDLGHPGIFVKAFDGDSFEKHNKYRQLCTPMDIGRNKAVAMIEKINLNFGFGWEAVQDNYDVKKNIDMANITISCVDCAAFRNDFHSHTLFDRDKVYSSDFYDFKTPFYWLDCGNGKNFGQIILGSIQKIKQPKTNSFITVDHLKNVVDIYGNMEEYDNEITQKTKGCSVASLLEEQDVFVNDMAAVFAANILKKIFLDVNIKNNGVIFSNFKSLPINL
ncbi:PRTRC system ThiF family protein [Tenacibaculum ovolyticum]|uniref:PRTRC system ThiF family protein n=1 Tax=Tenacibaculum ovolyticum TaxID=104270 RepID=UPI0007ED78AD|nr:PRTRC system ThiF family protein [Tenacibaculum ovolyticum]